MAVSRVKTSSILQGFPKSRSLLAGNSAYQPSSYESIQTITVGSGGSGSISFTSIPSTYKHLQIRGIARTTESAETSKFNMNLNGDSGTNYTRHYILGDGSSVSASGSDYLTLAIDSYMPGANGSANVFGAAIIDITDYSNVSKLKTIRYFSAMEDQGTATGRPQFGSALWRSTTAISTITFTPSGGNFAQYSSFGLYGVL